jgi:hypothetical protein
MDGQKFAVAVHLHGTLAANAQGAFALPCGATLVEVSACQSNDADATLKVGVGGASPDDDGILGAFAIGDSSAPVVKDRGDFGGVLVSGQLWHGERGTILTWLLDFDGSSGTAAANVDILFTFIEG